MKQNLHKSNLIAQNKRAYHEYFIENEIEVGISLQGWEIKSLRYGQVSITDSYVMLNKGEAYLLNSTIQPIITTSNHIICNPQRDRKLLLNKYELISLNNKVKQKNYTIIALLIYWKKAWCKLKIGLAKGKKHYDKRNDIKNREWQINKSKVIKFNLRTIK
ncbi:MAG: SsrA-binding protein SmpB [Pantoea sp. Brub]|nr:SsrA-binding protein SmpB [Pantoea sp. Brub]